VTEPWPIGYLRPRNVTRHLAPRTTAGTVSASGFTQRVSVPAHCWYITYENILVATPEQIRVWDAYEAFLEGGAVPILVPLIGDASYGSDTGYASAGPYAKGAAVMTVGRADGPILAGHHFSINERLYRTFGVTDLGGGYYNFSFRPPLRDDVPNGWAVWFAALQVKCRLMTDDEMTLKLEPGRMGTASVRFVEDPNP
jgi:hypothetical protein